jgi:hypothetical protein
VTHVRLLFAGKFLEDEKTLQEVPHVSVSDTTTFHVIVMAPPPPGSLVNPLSQNDKLGGDAAGRQGGASAARCQCVVS